MFSEMPDTYTFSSSPDRSPKFGSNGSSPDLPGFRNTHGPQIGGSSASPALTGSHFGSHLDDSPGSANGGENIPNRLHPTTPDGVNAQSAPTTLVQNKQDCDTNRKQDLSNVNSGLITVDATQLAEMVRSVIREEIGALKTAVRDQVTDLMLDQIHLDIVHLQAAILLKLQEQQVSRKTKF